MRDTIQRINRTFQSEQEAINWFQGSEFILAAKKKFGAELPVMFEVQIGIKTLYHSPVFEKQGIPMDWEYYTEQKPITPEVISAERNAEKRALLMLEYGILDFLENIQHIDTHPVYGMLISSTMPNELGEQFWVIVEDPQPITKEKRQYLRERNMLSDKGNELVYIPVPDTMCTAKEAVAWTFGLQEQDLPEEGFDVEC